MALGFLQERLLLGLMPSTVLAILNLDLNPNPQSTQLSDACGQTPGEKVHH